MSLPCPVPHCTRVMPGHATVCRACSSGLLRDLADVPSLDLHLDITLTRQARLGTRGAGGQDDGALPWDQRAREARDVLRSALVGWVRVLLADEERPGPACPRCEHASCLWIAAAHAPADTLPALARWLIRQRRALLAHPAVEEAVDELVAAVRQARRAIDRPAGTWYAGPCGVEDCTADLYARHGARTIRCHTCQATHDADDRETWLLDQVADVLGTAAEIARALSGFTPGLTSAKVRGLAHRGRILARGETELGRPLYRVGDVLDIVSASA
ncbi:hypothetical protein [Streptosporangium sp. NPDC051022]|uniref:hypothetical protein n=1 Tax=Streptosporangium sp. NPDC051022 TaxID=3155752 RepID=UPI00342F17C6